MANNRMAGEKLNEDTKESAEAKEALSRSESNKQRREEIAASPELTEERLSGLDREKYDFSDYSDSDIVKAFQGGTFGDEDYARLTGKPLDNGEDESGGSDEGGSGGGGGGGGGTTPTPTPTPSPDPTPPVTAPPGLGYGPNTQTQIVNQNNDINSNVTGDNNTVTNNQDNSVRQYGAYGTADRAKSLRDRYVADVSRFVRA